MKKIILYLMLMFFLLASSSLSLADNYNARISEQLSKRMIENGKVIKEEDTQKLIRMSIPKGATKQEVDAAANRAANSAVNKIQKELREVTAKSLDTAATKNADAIEAAGVATGLAVSGLGGKIDAKDTDTAKTIAAQSEKIDDAIEWAKWICLAGFVILLIAILASILVGINRSKHIGGKIDFIPKKTMEMVKYMEPIKFSVWGKDVVYKPPEGNESLYVPKGATEMIRVPFSDRGDMYRSTFGRMKIYLDPKNENELENIFSPLQLRAIQNARTFGQLEIS